MVNNYNNLFVCLFDGDQCSEGLVKQNTARRYAPTTPTTAESPDGTAEKERT